jgi:hypothetical protein
MSSAREEILRISIDKLRNKIESTMFSINIILSHPDNCDKQVDKISELLVELSVAELSMKHGQSLLTQCLEQRLREIEAQTQETKQPEE